VDDTLRLPQRTDMAYWLRPTFVVKLEPLAAGDSDTYAVMVAPCKLEVRECWVVDVDGDRAANGDNYRNFILYNKGTDGTGTAQPAMVNTSENGITRYVPFEVTLADMTIAPDDRIIEKGEVVVLSSTPSGAGVAQGEGALVLVCKPVMER